MKTEDRIERLVSMVKDLARCVKTQQGQLDQAVGLFHNALAGNKKTTVNELANSLPFNPAAIQAVMSSLYRWGFVKKESDGAFRSNANKDVIRRVLSELGLKN